MRYRSNFRMSDVVLTLYPRTVFQLMRNMQSHQLRGPLFAGIVAITIFFCGCSSGGNESEITPRQLKNGKTIEVLYSQEESFGQKDKVLMFSYRTHLKIDDLPSLK